MVYGYDDVLTNNEFNYTKAWNLAKALNGPIDCGTIFHNPIVENLQSTYDNLSATYDILIKINNDYSLHGPNPDNLSEIYFHDLSSTLNSMYPILQELRSEISNLTAGTFQVGLNCARFNMAYEVYKGYEGAKLTYLSQILVSQDSEYFAEV